MGRGELRGRGVRHLRRRPVPGRPQYPAGTYEQPYQADPYQGGQYDPYAYGGTSTAYDQNYTQGYDPTAYDPANPPHPPHPPHHGTDSERPDGSQQ
ncbi:hypothetical protein SAV14893_045490 [Streptomyces avermitilis]|uniref:Uncharacterized protein n=1 Tax=Streptomyces avermitilis TaxID=33903 RepID=A0A4D4LZD5_STRAX|nr:hypothetical protein SAV14893_045490 [Streptomyces avermitilis]GDY83680.1 hypothetical protein SAVCW2_28790 [Streptomyces avermitilis]